jgi:hypothetical protein
MKSIVVVLLMACCIIGALFLLNSLLGCGGSPLSVCNQTYQERCYDKNSDGIPEIVEICDGKHWNKVMDCSEQWNSSGELIRDKCVVFDNKAKCVSR